MARKSRKLYWFRYTYTPGDGKDGLDKPHDIVFKAQSINKAWTMIHGRRGLKALESLKTFEKLGGFITREKLTPGFIIERKVIRRIFVPLNRADRKDRTIF